MKKLRWPLVLVLFAVIAALGVVFYRRSDQADRSLAPPEAAKPSLPTAARNDLPGGMLLTKLDGSRVLARDLPGKTVLVLFLPDCDHCQRQAVQIREHLASFQAYALYFVSSAPLAQLGQFATTYRLAGHANVWFAYTDPANIISGFGYIPTPSLYVYAEGGRLVKAFQGETPIGAILQSL
ncbi:MAG: redoxin domain-containing protein [Ferruginibacter sp.]|nr:redoxin domain-containing protein [Cytophagales bacterium]